MKLWNIVLKRVPDHPFFIRLSRKGVWGKPHLAFPSQGGRSAWKMIQWIIFSIGRAAAPYGGP